jgi:hypothetical protein
LAAAAHPDYRKDNMNRRSALILTSILGSIVLAGCLILTPTQTNQVSEAYIQTAVASTLAAERAKAAGEALSYTATPEGTPAEEGTPDPEATVQEEDQQASDEQEPTPENPWMLQSYCVDHPDKCVYYGLNNRTDSWLQIELKESDTGVTGFFSVRSKTYAEIQLIPGQYRVKYTWWCEGNASSFSEVKGINSYVDAFKCPQGWYQRQSK